jgi:hypothetical protein
VIVSPSVRAGLLSLRERFGDDHAFSRRELACASCGYGISVVALPHACPMCQGSEWRPLARPFARRPSARFSELGQPR